MSDAAGIIPSSANERRAVLVALILNVALFLGLVLSGLLADSSGLIASGLDNASDAAVYAISFFAIGRAVAWKIHAAQFSGAILIVLSLIILADVGRRVVEGADPIGSVMIVMTIVAAIINILCLKLLRSVRGASVNLRAAWTFSLNDLASNLGILIAGILVTWLDSSWPDIVVGLVIVLITAKGGISILVDAHRTGSSQEDLAPRA